MLLKNLDIKLKLFPAQAGVILQRFAAVSVFFLFPAQAGVILRMELKFIPSITVPRASGGDPIIVPNKS